MPSGGQRRRFAKEERQHLAPGHAEGAQRADFLAPGHDRDRHGVVDEEQPDQQRDPRQRRQVQMKRRQHGLDLLAAPRWPLRMQAGRQPSRDLVDGAFDAPLRRQLHVDAIEPAEPIEGELRGGDVHEHEVAVEHPRRSLILQQPADDVGVHAIAGHQRDLAAERVVVPPRELLGDDHRTLVGQQLEQVGASVGWLASIENDRLRTLLASINS